MKKRTLKLIDVLKRFKLESLVIGSSCASITLSYTNWDSEAAWLLYVELITRVTSQPLDESEGDEQTALESIHSVFAITRDILKNYGKNARSFTPVALILVNKLLRPFTSKWHRQSIQNGFNKDDAQKEFRNDLNKLRESLVSYIKLLAEMSGVSDFVDVCL